MTKRPFVSFVGRNAAYSLALFMERGLAFLLLPLYSYVLSPADYGVYAVLFSFISIALFFYGLGVENNLLAHSEDPAKKDDLMGTAFWVTVLTSTLLSGVLLASSIPLSALLLRDVAYAPLVCLSAGILWSDALNRFFLYRLLGMQRAKAYVWISVVRGMTGLAANAIFLLVFKFGLKGVFLSYVMSNLVVLLVLAFIERGEVRFHVSRPALRALMRFGSPVMWTSLCITLLNFFDRYLLETLVSAEQAGWYSAAYRIGFVVNLAVTAFAMGALPYTSSLLKKDTGERSEWKRLMHFSFLIFISLFLFTALFIQDLVRIRILGYAVINPAYWKSMVLVPVVALAYVFYGLFINFSLAFYHTGKTAAMARVVFASFLVNLAANLALIPRYGSRGAAAATVLGFLFMAIAGFAAGRRLFPVQYGWGKILPLFAAALLIYAWAALTGRASWIMRMVLLISYIISGLLVLFNPFHGPRSQKAVT
jgi:O-antigen/teichoic acid export membrane protein